MTIDVHGHVTSPELFKRFPMPATLADIDGMVERKAALGITTTIVGSPVGAGTMVPVPGIDNYAQTTAQLETFHDWVAETVRGHGNSLKGYVYLNPLEGGDTVERAAARLRQEEFVGLIVNSSVRGTLLGDPRAEEFFAMAAETRAPVLLHPPAVPVGAEAVKLTGLVEHVARPCDITMGVASILAAGWLVKYPDLKLIAPNAGGALSLLSEKLDMAHRRDNLDGPSLGVQLRQIYVDTATPSSAALTAALTVFGPARMLFGTDSPPLATPLADTLALIDELPVSDAERALILRDNASAVFGLDVAPEVRRAS